MGISRHGIQGSEQGHSDRHRQLPNKALGGEQICGERRGEIRAYAGLTEHKKRGERRDSTKEKQKKKEEGCDVLAANKRGKMCRSQGRQD